MGERTDDHPARGHTHGHGPAHGHAHGHGTASSAGAPAIRAAMGLLLAFMALEVVMAVVGHSLALLADAGHMLTDVGGLGAALIALRLAVRPARGAWTFGFRRAEVLSAQINGVTLLVVSALVAVESVRRLVHPPHTRGGVLLWVAGVGVLVNVAAAWVLGRADRGSIAVRGSLQHVVTDLYAFIGTFIAGIVIVTSGFRRADPIASLVVVALMLHAAWGLLRDTGRILLEAAPEGLDADDVVAAMTANAGVASVHDVHVWLITSGFPALSAHVLVRPPADCHAVRHELELALRERFGLDHTTLQVDHAPEELLTIERRGPPSAGH